MRKPTLKDGSKYAPAPILVKDIEKTQDTFSFEWKMFRFGDRNWGHDIPDRKLTFHLFETENPWAI